MHNISIARHFRGVTAKDLSDRLGVANQHISGWERGIRNPNRSAAERLAKALDVDVAWIMECPQTEQLRDPLSGDILYAQIMRTEALPGYGLMQHLYLPEHDIIVAIIRSLDVAFTPADWQSAQPQTAADIPDHRWMDAHGNDAVMLDGLPRRLV